MKKTVVCVGIMILSIMLCCCSKVPDAVQTTEQPPDEVLGGWENIPHEAEELPDDAQEAFDKVKESLDDGDYTPVSLLATQVVAGTNYCILCQITPHDSGAESKWALVYIYADLQGNAELINVYELYIAQHSTPKE